MIQEILAIWYLVLLSFLKPSWKSGSSCIVETILSITLWKEYVKAIYFHPDYLTYMQNTRCTMPGWMKCKLQSRLPADISTSDMQMTPPVWQKGKRRPKNLLIKVREWKSWLKLNIQKIKIIVSGLITSWQLDGETLDAVTDFIFLGSKIPANDDCSQEIKRHLLLGGKVMTNLDSILKSRDISLPTKVNIVKAMIFALVRYGCESWTLKKIESWWIDAFELWCWESSSELFGQQGD